MANINLLPWRDELRAEKQKQFYTVLVVVCIAAGAAVFVWFSAVNTDIESQRIRNNMLQREITQLEQKVDEIKDLRRRREELIGRMDVIQSLQGNRPQIVRVFDDLVRMVPDGVYFTQLSREGQQISVSGIAESNNRVSSLMRQLDESQWFESPNLQSVSRAREGGDDELIPNTFKMTVQISSPDDGKKDGV
ncbi:PilN domain-containing protein [Sessilibacter corallicola]|uniref:Type 4a pilus biogenesis protein PilN n=1 Tax=Sessilibacter corallicola TaxID=2904075 RepID=A0ABQ0A5D9_9GAMM